MTKRNETTGAPTGSSRVRSRERRRERQQAKRQQRRTLYAIAVVVVAVVAATVFILVNQPASAPIPQGALDRYDGIPKDVTEDGFPVLGNPDAPVRVEEYSSFTCTACAAFHEEAMDTLVGLARDGVISLTFIPVTGTGSIPNPEGAARAALCAGEQGYFFEYHDALFSWQAGFGNNAFSHNRLVSGIENLGLDRGDYNGCLDSSPIGRTIDAATNQFRDSGATGTPAIFVNGVAAQPDLAAVVAAINSALAASGIEPVPLNGGTEATPESTPEMTPESTPEISQSEATEEVPGG